MSGGSKETAGERTVVSCHFRNNHHSSVLTSGSNRLPVFGLPILVSTCGLDSDVLFSPL